MDIIPKPNNIFNMNIYVRVQLIIIVQYWYLISLISTASALSMGSKFPAVYD